MTWHGGAPTTGQELLGRVLTAPPPGFALLHRPETVGSGMLEVFVGEVAQAESLADIPLSESSDGSGQHQEVLALIPYRQVSERGFEAPDDEAPLLALTIAEQGVTALPDALRAIRDVPIVLRDKRFDLDDDAYAEIVRRVIADEIGTGKGANFVIKRSFVADITDYSVFAALAFFRRLVEREQGAYWTFIVHTGDRTFVGASPERHVSVHGGTAIMNPISGTYRYPSSGPTLPGVMDFLADRKEAEELYMVVDEELKMMARICPDGGRVVGPYLKEMTRLAHTEYFIEGRTSHDPRVILRETMFAPTVTGSPLESACRVIERYEPMGRGYYSGVAALIGRDAGGGRTMDSAILIRTADIDGSGRVSIGVGATLVRHSDPLSEVAETRVKAAGLLTALEEQNSPKLASHPQVLAALEQRNTSIAGFWLADDKGRAAPHPLLAGRRVLIVDAEDTFTSMIAQQLRAMAFDVAVRRFDEPYAFDGFDLVVVGPGPGDPRDVEHPKVAHLNAAIATLLEEQRPFLAVCLSHQVLSLQLGLELRRRDTPNQGVQRAIDLFGRHERVGFYNTFVARCTEDTIQLADGSTVEVSRDESTGEVHALRAARFASMQFHVESVLTKDGLRIVSELLAGLRHGEFVG